MQYTTHRKPHNTYNFSIPNNKKLCVSSDFDGGSMESARLIAVNQLQDDLQVSVQMCPAAEPFNPNCSNKQSSKNFFNFSIKLMTELEDQGEEFAGNIDEQQNQLSEDNMQNKQQTQDIKQQLDILGNYSLSDYVSDGRQTNNREARLAPEYEKQSGLVIEFRIKKMNVPPCLDEQQFVEIFRPCIGTKQKQNKFSQPIYSKFKPKSMKLKKQTDNTYTFIFTHKCWFTYDPRIVEKFNDRQIFDLCSSEIFFAYHYPYSNEKLREYIFNLERSLTIQNQNTFRQSAGQQTAIYRYFRKQLLVQTLEGRFVDLLTLTAITDSEILNQITEYYKLGRQDQEITLDLEREPRISKSLFPFYEMQPRPYKFNKPIIFITCRVHPGETSSSFALQGILNKLFDGSPEADFLLKTFVFKIIPIVNPDGVFHGTYRMDPLGQNLNRFYDQSTSHKQPNIFAIQTLLHFYSASPLSVTPSQNKLYAYFDLHAHSKLLPAFIYGNAYQSIWQQTQSQLFCRALETIDEYFKESNCSFSEKNMNSKDAVEIMSKSGSGRLCAFRNMKNLVHCYTIQMPFIGTRGDTINKQSLQDLEEDPENGKSSPKKEQTKNNCLTVFNCETYRKTGEQLINNLATIYIHSMGPTKASKAKNQQKPNKFRELREELAKEIYLKEDRFRAIENMAGSKLKNIETTILKNLYSKMLKQFPMTQFYLTQYWIEKGSTEKVRPEIIKYKNFRSKTPVIESENHVEQDKSEKLVVPQSAKLIDVEPSNVTYLLEREQKSTNNKVSVTPIKFNIEDPRKKKQKYMNLRKMVEFYSESNHSEPQPTNRVIKGKTQIKIKVVNGPELSKPSLSVHKANSESTKKNKQNQQFDSQIDKQGFSFYLLHGSESYKNLRENQLQKTRKKETISYQKSNPKNSQWPTQKEAQKQEYQPSRVSVTEKLGSIQQTRLGNTIGPIKTKIERDINQQSTWKHRNAFLPKLELMKAEKRVTDKKYGIELKIKEKYDRKYKIEDIKAKSKLNARRDDKSKELVIL